MKNSLFENGIGSIIERGLKHSVRYGIGTRVGSEIHIVPRDSRTAITRPGPLEIRVIERIGRTRGKRFSSAIRGIRIDNGWVDRGRLFGIIGDNELTDCRGTHSIARRQGDPDLDIPRGRRLYSAPRYRLPCRPGTLIITCTTS
jgi:hypothetical protein